MDGVNLYQQFLALHRPQLASSGVPEHFWESLYRKLSADTMDAGTAFSLLLIDYGDTARDERDPVWAVCVSKSTGIDPEDPNEIYLIDHAWTFQTNQARSILENYPQVSSRMASIMGITTDDLRECNKEILNSLWKFCQPYSIQAEGASVEARMPIWYVMDEVGSGINHSDEPNFRLVPFLYIPTQVTYSLLFPIVFCEEGEQVTRDFVENIAKTPKERRALLLPWKYTDFRNESFQQVEPNEDYFTSGHIPELLPEEELNTEPKINHDEQLKVYSEYDVLTNHLTGPQFEIVDTMENADILWLTTHFKNFKELAAETPDKFVNQFPYEYVITIKDLLSVTCRRKTKEHHNKSSLETYPKWLPTTYNLKTELIEFVSYFQNREDKNLDNHWIIKPWNLARGLDTHITSNLSQITRLSSTGPKIAQKYLERPVLFYRDDVNEKVKFDIRYVLLLKSAKEPLEVYVYRKFFLRFANKAFSLDEFDNYEKHFTVMNYNEKTPLRHLKCEDFVIEWENQYPQYPWEKIEEKIFKMFKELFQCATLREPPCGIASCKKSRALYAADIMLSWDQEKGSCRQPNEGDCMQPKLLEINWMPDCRRACDYYPDFYNSIFQLLFLGELDQDCIQLITEMEN